MKFTGLLAKQIAWIWWRAQYCWVQSFGSS
jgi:hypothetical protein